MSDSNSKIAEGPDRTRKRRVWLTDVLLLVAVTIAMLALFELGLRITEYNPLANQPPKTIVDLSMHTPNSDRMIDVSLLDPQHPRSRLRIDSRSYILPSLHHGTPDATIAFLGGSTTECSAVKEALRFPALVSEVLGAKELNVKTLNAGHSGNTLHDSINILLNHVVYDRPDIVVVMNVANDVGILGRRTADYHVRSGRQLTFSDVIDWFKWTASQHLNLAGVARQSLIVLRGRTTKAYPGDLMGRERRTDPAFADTLPSHLYEQRLRVFVGVARGLGIIPVLMTEPLSDIRNELTPDWADMGGVARFNEIVRRVGEEEQVPVIDLVGYLSNNVPGWAQPMKVFYDGIHVTDYGSEVYARHIAERLEPLLRQVIAQRHDSNLH